MRGEGCPTCSRERTASHFSLSKEEFISKSMAIHGNFFDYKKVKYTNMKTNVSIKCPIHGTFKQLPHVHLQGSGCPSCVEHGFSPSLPAFVYILATKDKKFMKVGVTNNIKSRLSKLRQHTPFEFKKIREFRFPIGMTALLAEKNAHQLLKTADMKGFDGSTEWFIYNDEVILLIRNQSRLHKNDKESKKIISNQTSITRLLRRDKFIENAKSEHGSKYDYHLVDYVNAYTKVKIICPIHGVFEQNPSSHKKGIGCSRCSGHKKTNEDAINDFKKRHGDCYDYSKVEYVNSKKKVKIVCTIHGVFEQSPTTHLSGSGCPKCYLEKKSKVFN